MPAALSVAVFNGWTKTLLILAIFFCMELVTANLLEPHVNGKHTGLSSLAILVAAIFWALIWGPIGLILSVPLTVCLVVVGAHVPSLQFLTVLLGDQPVMQPDAHYYQRLLANDQREASQVLETNLKGTSLETLYDSVLVPALHLAEQDRHRNELDDTTVSFITQTTKDLVEELGLRQDDSKPAEFSLIGPQQRRLCASRCGMTRMKLWASCWLNCWSERVLRDRFTDWECGGNVGGSGQNRAWSCLPVCIAPVWISHARGIYRRLRVQYPKVKIIVGLWNYTEDPVKAAAEVSGGEQNLICTTLAQITLQASLAAGASLKAVPA